MVAFFDELKVFGFIDTQNLKIVLAGFDLREDQFGEVAATLAKARPDVVFCVSDDATRAAQQSAHTVAIVALSADLIAAGLVRSLADPGGNITGVSILANDLNGKRLEILMEVVPGARRIAALADPKVTQPAELQALQNAGRVRGVELVIFTAGTPKRSRQR
jgi:putative ABC transport system substrate-binding protein